jgi:hypothetical protein
MRARRLLFGNFGRMLGSPWRNRGIVLSTLACCFLLIAHQVPGEEAVYHVVNGDEPVAAASNGYVQEVRLSDAGGVEVYVETSLAPIGATGSYGNVVSGEVPDIPVDFVVPQNLVDRLRPELSSWEAATLVLSWVVDRVKIDTSDTGPQDAVSILDRGRGRCSGVANASVAMLLAAGFEARTVSGLLIGKNEAIPHRWLECRLPGAGWVASDPTLGLWTVTPRHIVFPDTVETVPEIRVVSSSGDGLDRLPRRAGRVVRPNRGADLVCRLPSAWHDLAPMAVLRGSGGEVLRARLDPEARFSDLLPGKWILEVAVGDSVIERTELILRPGAVNSYTVQRLGIEPRRDSGS